MEVGTSTCLGILRQQLGLSLPKDLNKAKLKISEQATDMSYKGSKTSFRFKDRVPMEK